MALASPLAAIDTASDPAAAPRPAWYRGARMPRWGWGALALAVLAGAWIAAAWNDPLGPWIALGALSAAVGGLAGELWRARRQRDIDTTTTLLRLAAASRAQSAFLANTSHELRTPLNAVIGYAELLTAGVAGPLSARQALYIETIRASGRHLLEVVSAILDLAAAEAGRLVLDIGAVAPRALVERCAAQARERMATRALGFAVDCAADLPAIAADQSRVEQILVALLSNAARFTETGGTVTLRARATADRGVAFVVADSGPGMTDAEIALALAPFSQVDGSLERRHDGIGLGLPLAQRLTALLGGSLSIDSVKGRGTVVTVSLPLARAGTAPLL
ncbi:MAG: hypothetical protein HY060_19570 [Proteobacteria bacterium]|nr:hypothetical protein [Pseudomonadota bacterium]